MQITDGTAIHTQAAKTSPQQADKNPTDTQFLDLLQSHEKTAGAAEKPQQAAAKREPVPKTDPSPQAEESDRTPSAREAFLAWMSMSWEERYFASALHRRGLTQEEYEALPPEKQEEIAEEIRQEMRDYIDAKNRSGAAEPEDT